MSRDVAGLDRSAPQPSGRSSCGLNQLVVARCCNRWRLTVRVCQNRRVNVSHPSGIPDAIVRKVMARRGRLHAFETITSKTTALVIIDLDVATVGTDDTWRELVQRVNTLADVVRRTGGVVAWVLSSMDTIPKHFAAILGEAVATRYVNDGHGDSGGTKVHPDLTVLDTDIVAVKSGASAFFPGKCNLKEQLDVRGIDTVLIAGTVTNICCESSARDAAELQYKVIMVSDALAGQAHGLHEATLATFYRIFGDVRPSAEVARLLDES